MAAGRQGEPLASSAMSMKGLLVLLVMVGGLVGGLPATASVALTTDVAVGQASARPLTLVYGGQKFVASAGQVAQWYKVNGEQLQLRPGAIYDFLNTKVSPRVNDLGEQSRFAYVGSNLHLLQGGRKGKIVDGVKTSLAIRSALVSGKSSVAVHMKQYRPSVFSAEDFKKLSFPHKLAVGESNFAGSPANRVHNIHVATKQYDGLVLLPGEEFSFNQYLGEVDASNGYLPELVIKEGVTTPEYGGGVCQVSTTAFRGRWRRG